VGIKTCELCNFERIMDVIVMLGVFRNKEDREVDHFVFTYKNNLKTQEDLKEVFIRTVTRGVEGCTYVLGSCLSAVVESSILEEMWG
jgi:hypothetical protein